MAVLTPAERHDQLSQQPVTHLLTCTYGRNMEYATNV